MSKKLFLKSLIFIADEIKFPFCFIYFGNNGILQAYKYYLDIPKSKRHLIYKTKYISVTKNSIFEYGFVIFYERKIYT